MASGVLCRATNDIIRLLFQELAKYEEMEHQVTLTEKGEFKVTCT